MTLAQQIPVIIEIDGTYEVTEDLILVHRKSGRQTLIPKGFRTDLASVPRFMSWLTPIAGVHDIAAIRHDRNCVEQADAYREGRPSDVTSVQTDGMFLDDLLELGVPLYRSRAYWVGVRLGAVANRARRAGWWSTAPEVLLWTVLLLPVVPAAVLVWVTLALGKLVSLIVGPPPIYRRRLRAERLQTTKDEFAARRKP